MSRDGFEQLYLDEVEARLRCTVPFCQGQVQALIPDGTEGFVGRLA
jgi:hypothetical protein